MKSILTRLGLWTALMLLCSPGFATHMVGNDLTWSCNPQDPCEITFTLSFYRDCAGVGHIPANLNFTGSNGCTAQPSEVSSGWVLQSTVEITPICGSVNTTCNGGTFPGVEQIIHTRTYNFCKETPCNSYEVTWGQGDRNGIITSGAANDFYGTSSTITIDPQDCYNSPVFNSIPVAYICSGQTNTFSMNATDPDGDQLVYSLVACEQRTSSGALVGNVGYNTGFSPTAPLGPSWNTSINTATGDITFAPNPGNVEVGVLCVRVDEYRNGQLVGSIVRDIQVRVINCRNTPPTIEAKDSVSLCVGEETCFEIHTSDPDVGQTLTASVLSAPAGANVSITGQPPVIDICWTPTAADVGTHFVTVEVRDDACPLNGITQKTIVLTVKECDPCTELNLNASFTYTTGLNSITVTNTSTGNGITFTEFIWGDNSTTIRPGNWTTPESHTYSNPGTYNVCVVIQAFVDDLCCHDTVCTTVTITDDPCDFHEANFIAQASTQGCTYCFFDISTPTSTYQYWNFGDGSPIVQGSNVCHTFPGTGTYTITLTSVYVPASDPHLCCYSTKSVTWYIPCRKLDEPVSELEVGFSGPKKAEINFNNQDSRLSINLSPTMVENGPAKVQLYTATGQLVRELAPMQDIHSEEYLHNLSKGVYLLRVSGTDFAETYRFVKY